MAGLSKWYIRGKHVGWRITFSDGSPHSLYLKGTSREDKKRAKEKQKEYSLLYPYSRSPRTTSKTVGVHLGRNKNVWEVPFKDKRGKYKKARFPFRLFKSKETAEEHAIACRKFLVSCRVNKDMKSFYSWWKTEKLKIFRDKCYIM